ncbi:RICIN domain-containing protein [Amycolatopsis sp. RTGN1]|uniref:RICIN domain-containing protein n=1 Tax=Amycolatopsis ponsaeliensis TaxID=2992142 RepID=UPI00254A04B4|nr:RICIN domain-containing protein [Amycolatopsis sp. RTGN1]
MRRPTLLTAALVVVAGALVVPASAAATFTSTMVNPANGSCATVPGSGSAVQLTQAACTSGAGQSFTFTPASGDAYTIGTFTAGSCVDISGASTSDNAAVIQYACHSGTNQQFRLQSVGTNIFTVVAVSSGKCVVPANNALVQLPCSGSSTAWRLPGFTPGTSDAYQGIPNLAPNACKNSGLPRSYGTNFQTPNDPYGQGFQNTTAIGWDGNYWPVSTYLSGSFFARGVPTTYNGLCGGMYSFSAYTYGGNPGAQSVQWTEDNGYLPAMTTSRTSGSVGITIKNFAAKVTVNGSAFMLVYTRVSIKNNGSASVTVPPGGSGPNLVRLTSSGLDTVAAGQTSNHDFVVAVDNFGSGAALPTGSTLSSNAPNYDTAYSQMASYWNARLAETNTFSLPNTTLPNTGNLANPGTAMANAYKAGTIYNLIMQVGQAQFSGANNYNWILNHDVPGELTAKFETGDFRDARNLLLTARISEQDNWDEVGANWYWDGVWKTMGTWATYLAKTNDTAFVGQYFHDDPSSWGPSLYTIARVKYPAQLASDGTLRANFDNDSTGRWLFSNFSALQMLASYKYIATKLGQTSEATWADGAYTSLLNALNTVVGRNQSTNGFSYLPCEVDKPNSANRCTTFNDANWASPGWVGQNQWSTMLSGGALTGIMGDPGQIDRMYQWGFNRLSGNGYPFPTFGAFNGYSTAYNTSYSSDGLFSNTYRDLPITSYAWQLKTTTGGPNAWWEANGSGPNPANPWIGSHAGPQFGACPYAWPIAGQQQGLLESLVAEGLASTGSGPYTFTRPLYLGRGVPNAWLTPGQTISVGNLTNTYDVASGSRSTYGVSLAVSGSNGARVVTVTLSGNPPGGAVSIQLPVFFTIGVNSVSGGTYNSATHTVTASANTVTISLAG